MRGASHYYRITGSYEYKNGRCNFGTVVGAEDIGDAIEQVNCAIGRHVRIDNVQHLGQGLSKTLDDIAGIEKRYGKVESST
jgi:hypothetical protein